MEHDIIIVIIGAITGIAIGIAGFIISGLIPVFGARIADVRLEHALGHTSFCGTDQTISAIFVGFAFGDIAYFDFGRDIHAAAILADLVIGAAVARIYGLRLIAGAFGAIIRVIFADAVSIVPLALVVADRETGRAGAFLFARGAFFGLAAGTFRTLNGIIFAGALGIHPPAVTAAFHEARAAFLFARGAFLLDRLKFADICSGIAAIGAGRAADDLAVRADDDAVALALRARVAALRRHRRVRAIRNRRTHGGCAILRFAIGAIGTFCHDKFPALAGHHVTGI